MIFNSLNGFMDFVEHNDGFALQEDIDFITNVYSKINNLNDRFDYDIVLNLEPNYGVLMEHSSTKIMRDPDNADSMILSRDYARDVRSIPINQYLNENVEKQLDLKDLYEIIDSGKSVRSYWKMVPRVAINRTVGQLVRYDYFSSSVGNKYTLINDLYPNWRQHDFDYMKGADDDFIDAVSNFKTVLNESNQSILHMYDHVIDSMQDLINFINDNLKYSLQGYGESEEVYRMALNTSSMRYHENKYMLMKDMFPDMQWLDYYDRITDEVLQKLALPELAYRYCKENLKFRSIMFEDSFHRGPFGNVNVEYFDYLLANRIPDLLDLDVEDMREKLYDLSKALDADYLETNIENFLKDEYDNYFSNQDFDNIKDIMIKNIMNAGKYKMGVYLEEMFNVSLLYLYRDQSRWFHLFDTNKNLFKLLVYRSDIENVISDIALLMDNKYQIEWIKANGPLNKAKDVRSMEIVALDWYGQIPAIIKGQWKHIV